MSGVSHVPARLSAIYPVYTVLRGRVRVGVFCSFSDYIELR